ncbi:MAG: hypothetical protein JOY62_11465 [Acidobacteriaceae bacterium]|nr:hypothetical protein [Acidobacteriaceae bacterium]
MGIALQLAGFGAAQSTSEQGSTVTQSTVEKEKKPKKDRGAASEMGHGAGDMAGGAAKGAGSLAKGTAKGAGDLATLHPIDAATDVGKGAAGAGKNAGVGAAKGTGKIAKGIGKAFKHLL